MSNKRGKVWDTYYRVYNNKVYGKLRFTYETKPKISL